MTPSVLASEPRRLNLGVDLRRGEAGVTEQLLDRAEIRAALEQVGRERVPQRMRGDPSRDRRLPDPALQPAAHVRWVKPPPALRQKQRILGRTHESGTSPFQVTPERRL